MLRFLTSFTILILSFSSFGQISDINLNCPDSIQVRALDEVPEPFNYLTELIYGGGSVSSTCDINQSSFKLKTEYSDSLTNNPTITRTYQIDDICSNQSTCSHVITVGHITKASSTQIPNFTFSIKPNPSNGIFEISLISTSIKNYKVKIIDSFGRTVESRKIHAISGNHTERFDISQFDKGTYYIILSTSENYISNTIIIH